MKMTHWSIWINFKEIWRGNWQNKQRKLTIVYLWYKYELIHTIAMVLNSTRKMNIYFISLYRLYYILHTHIDILNLISLKNVTWHLTFRYINRWTLCCMVISTASDNCIISRDDFILHCEIKCKLWHCVGYSM